MNIAIRTMIPTTMTALSAMSFTSCGNRVEHNNTAAKETPALKQPAPFDSTKANLPIIDGDRVIYRNIDGDVITVKSETVTIEDTRGRFSLYKAIQKLSTKDSPNITAPEKFYVEVEKQIPKNGSLGNLQTQKMFSELYDMFTDEDSEKGKTITVNEYTLMMDAWSSTGNRE